MSPSSWGPLTQPCHSRLIAIRRWAPRSTSDENSNTQPFHRKREMGGGEGEGLVGGRFDEDWKEGIREREHKGGGYVAKGWAKGKDRGGG
jgi:hypothetical protein